MFSVSCSPQAIAPTTTPTVQPEVVLDDLSFASGDINLVGRLILPAGEAPFPAIIWVHGSGRTTRDEVGSLLDILVDEGIAVFTYDKRGVGDSGGNYSEVTAYQGNTLLGLLAQDADVCVVGAFAARRVERAEGEIAHGESSYRNMR